MKKGFWVSIAIFVIVATGVVLLVFKTKPPSSAPNLTQEEVKQNEEYNKKLEKIKTDVQVEFDKIVKGELETWSLYKEISNSYFQPYQVDPSCPPSSQWLDFYQKAGTGKEYGLNLPYGMVLFYTPNYERWSSQQFSLFNNKEMGVCGAGGAISLYAYPDKVLWMNNYCGGAGAPDCDKNYYLQQLIGTFFKEKLKP